MVPRRFWTAEAEYLVLDHPWILDLVETNREVAAEMIAKVVRPEIERRIEKGREIHDYVTGVHKAMYTRRTELPTPWVNRPPFKENLSKIPKLHVISPALAAALKPME